MDYKDDLTMPNMANSAKCYTPWSDWLCLPCLLFFNILIALVVVSVVPFYAVNREYFNPAIDFATTGRIHSTFVSIGYSSLIGLGYRLTGSTAGITAVNILIGLLVLTSAWVYLRVTGLGVKGTLAVVSIMSIYPDFFLSYHKVQDTSLITLLLFCFLIAIVLLSTGQARTGYKDMFLALSIACAAIVRPNLMLLIPLSWYLLYRRHVPNLVLRAIGHLLVVVACYIGVTAAVHGRPFFPQNGPYNLYAGANQFTSQHLSNDEDSLVYAMAAQGIHVESDALYDAKYNSIYTHSALLFIRTHKIEMVRLTWLKFIAMMKPDLRKHSFRSPAGWAKIVSAMAIPLWLLGSLFLPQAGARNTRMLVGSTIVVTILPFLMTVATQRFREPLDFICWVDLSAMVLMATNKGKSVKLPRNVSRPEADAIAVNRGR